ncbi:Rha family transcriptional regulator [Prevotella sp. HUN102]|uniref:Rha family transcriptional regulator n=1 Tax=Prevotella sp. HUN102 TaxID=1392486 RepID=UPI0009DFA8B2|nr:Rha family transcriptional regulator [Prevotella sp. HUN102]
MSEIVYCSEDHQVLTNSLLVAEKFGKSHDNVLKAIRSILTGGVLKNNETPMFEEATYVSVQNGQEYPMFVMNRDGFTLLAMGFTGKKAMKFKLDYIAAFNKMETALKGQQEKPQQLTGAEYLLKQAQLMVEQEHRLKVLENRMDALDRERAENGRKLLTVTISEEEVVEPSLRDKIRQLVNRYAAATNTMQRDVWHKVYERLYYCYHISIRAYKKAKGETNLDVAERNHFLEKIYAIVSDLVREVRAV